MVVRWGCLYTSSVFNVVTYPYEWPGSQPSLGNGVGFGGVVQGSLLPGQLTSLITGAGN